MGRPKQLPPAAPTGQKQITGFFGGQKRAADSNEDLSVDWDALPESEGVGVEAGGEEVTGGAAPAVQVRRVRRRAAVMADDFRRCANAIDDDEFAIDGL